jgi:nucleoid DNA-binding protein
MTGLTQADTRIIVERLRSFYTKIRKARPARNPKTGVVVHLPRRVVPIFKFSRELKQQFEIVLKQKVVGRDGCWCLKTVKT